MRLLRGCAQIHVLDALAPLLTCAQTPALEKYLVDEREKWGSLVRKLGLEGSQ
jgi:hypothetical protein